MSSDYLPAMAMQDMERLKLFVEKHEEEIRVHYYGSLADKVTTLVDHYETTARNALIGTKSFRDDVVIWLRAFSLIIDMVANAATHREKNARLRGCAEMLESSMQKIRQEQFNFQNTFFLWEDVFRSDYPVRKFVERIHELERELSDEKAKHKESV